MVHDFQSVVETRKKEEKKRGNKSTFSEESPLLLASLITLRGITVTLGLRAWPPSEGAKET